MTTLARGLTGRLLAGYRVAATLGAWAVDRADDRFDDDTWTATAAVLSRDDYWLAHGAPFALELAMGPARWRWTGVRAEGAGPLVLRGHGKPEVTHA
jgi:hypothetical protein